MTREWPSRINRYILSDRGIAVPCEDLTEWAMYIEHGRRKHQLIDEIAGLRLSTVFLGLDHNWGDGDPLLWESMLFNDDEAATSELMNKAYSPEMGQWRFSYRDEAYSFHKRKVAELKTMLRDIGEHVERRDHKTEDT